MATYDNAYTTANSGRIGQVFAAIVAAIASWNDVRSTRNALRALSDRELDDIGLSRGDIENLR